MLACFLAWAHATPHDPGDPALGPTLGPLDHAVGILTFDTDLGLVTSGSGNAPGVVLPDGTVVFLFDSVTLTGQVEVRGTRPLAILSRGDLSVGGFGIDVSGLGGAGGTPGRSGGGNGGGGDFAGGSFGGVGGNGGPPAYGNLELRVDAGSGGGAGAPLGAGGAGGGALELGALGAITLAGSIEANGAAGENGPATGAGGGSGGAILVHGGPGSQCGPNTLLRANGGAAGGGGTAGGGGGGRITTFGLTGCLIGTHLFADGGLGEPFGLTTDGTNGVLEARERDLDADGYYRDRDGDCDDWDERRHPGASEDCNGVDDDCDSFTDEEAGPEWFADHDHDGFGAGSATQRCAPLADESPQGDDCDDADAGAFPGAPEVPGDGVDQDCDGVDAVAGGTGDTAAPDTGDTGSADTGDTAATHTADTATPETGDTATPETGDTATPETGDTATPETGDTGSPSDTGDSATTHTGDSATTPDTGDTGSPSDSGETDADVDTDADTDADTDTDTDTDTDAGVPPLADLVADAGCRCDGAGASGAWPLAALLLAVTRRHRRG